jgi:predicted DNA-binding transcriptional regulator AlpA
LKLGAHTLFATSDEEVRANMKVLDYNEAAKRGKITRRTLERQIADGVGPATVQLSKRRVGIFESDFEAWLLKRRRPAPGEDAEANPTPKQDRDQEEAGGSDGEGSLATAT